MPDSLHVLLVPSWYPTAQEPLNGIFFKEQAEALAGAGMKVGVLYPEMRSVRQLSIRSLLENHYQVIVESGNGVHTYRQAAWNIPFRKAKRKCVEVLTEGLFSKYIAEQGIPDAIHVHSALWAGISAMDIKKRYGIPYVVTEHSTAYARNLLSEYELQLTSQVFNGAEKRIAVSSRLARRLEAMFPGTTFDVVPNMVDTDFFSCGSSARTRTPFVFLSVAFLTAKKGMANLLTAFARAFGGMQDVRLEIGGDGECRAALEKKATELGVDNQVTFLGALNRSEVRDAMCRSSAFVLPSRYETFGVVLIEALSTGIPVIATRSGGPEDIVNDNVGLLVEPASADALANAMRLVMQKTYQERLIRIYAINNYEKKQIAQNIILTYKKILQKRGVL